MDADRVEAVKKKLNQTGLTGFEGVLAGDVLHYPIQAMTELGHQNRIRDLLRRIKWRRMMLKRLTTCPYRYRKTPPHGALFLFSSSYGDRTDHKRAFGTVAGLSAGGAAYAVYDAAAGGRSVRKLKYTGRITRWKKSLKEQGICRDGLERDYLLLSLTGVYCDYADAVYYFGDGFPDIDVLVSWCDVHAVDSFFVQRFHAMGKKTVDLMHGALSVTHNAWSVFGIKSRYFIADSRYTEELLKRHGYTGRIFVCGYPYGITPAEQTGRKEAEKTIGVIFAGAVMHQDNLAMYQGVSAFRNSGYRIMVKLHPSESRADYADAFAGSPDEIYGAEISASDFLGKITYAVLAPSTVVYETIRNRIPFVFFADRLAYYRQFEMPEEVTADAETLPEKVQDMLDGALDDITDSLGSYYTAQGDIRENYLNAFREIGILKTT